MPMAEDRILVTEDKDFGELVFVRRLPHPCIVRFTEMPVAEKATAMSQLIESHAGAMLDGSMIVVTPSVCAYVVASAGRLRSDAVHRARLAPVNPTADGSHQRRLPGSSTVTTVA